MGKVFMCSRLPVRPYPGLTPCRYTINRVSKGQLKKNRELDQK